VRVLQVITSGEAGGAQSHLLALSREVRQEVELVAAIGSTTGTSVLGAELESLGIETHHLPELRNSTNPLAIRRAAAALAALIPKLRPDVVHAHSSFAGAAARVAAHRCRIPCAYTVHGFGFKPQARRGVRQAAWVAEVLLAPWTSHMICVSQHEASLARKLPFAPKALSVVANGLPDVPERAAPSAEPAGVITVARLAAPKRPDLLLQALSLLPHPPATQVVGDGPERALLEAQAARLGLRQVAFPGSVGDVAQRLAAHSIFVLLSDHEGMPISVIEAMRAGMAIIATRLPGIEEMVVHGESALLVANNPQDVAQALRSLIADPALRGRLGAAARERYLRDFDARAMARRVMDVYRSLT
jgi:glycosyltransferase involved in cell wall biosynthesis